MSATSSGEVNIETAKRDKPVSADRSDGGESDTSVNTSEGSEDGGAQLGSSEEASDAPPLPEELPPPLPTEAAPDQAEDDGWAPVWDDRAQAFYFCNRFTNVSQWENPRIPEVAQPPPPGVGGYETITTTEDSKPIAPVVGGYDPAIHGDYDPNADYAKVHESGNLDDASINDLAASDPSQAYAATGAFNRFTGKWQGAELNPEKFNDENKSRRQMNAFFDVDAAANSHDGKSLKAERSGKKLSKKEVKAFKDKRREKKEEKRRAWLRD